MAMATRQESRNRSLFERIGGMPAVQAAVDIFYCKVVADDRISYFFQHIDMDKQSGKLKAFLAYAFGAPMHYDGKSMHAAHRHMQITEVHFDAVAGHLVDTLHELNVPSELIDEVLAVAHSVRGDIINTPAEDQAIRA